MQNENLAWGRLLLGDVVDVRTFQSAAYPPGVRRRCCSSGLRQSSCRACWAGRDNGGVTMFLGGTPTQEGLGHAIYWGGMAGSAGFGVGGAVGSWYQNNRVLPKFGGKEAPPRPGEQIPGELHRIGPNGKWFSDRPMNSLRELEQEVGPVGRSFTKSLYRWTAKTTGAESFTVGPTSLNGVLQFHVSSSMSMTAEFYSLSPAAVTVIQFMNTGITYYAIGS